MIAMEQQVEWRGAGRWMAFAGGGLLLVAANFQMAVPLEAIDAGCSIFLGLILIATVASGSRSAPYIALGLAIVLLLRAIVIPLLGGTPDAFLMAFIPLLPIAFAAWDLRAQRLAQIATKGDHSSR